MLQLRLMALGLVSLLAACTGSVGANQTGNGGSGAGTAGSGTGTAAAAAPVPPAAEAAPVPPAAAAAPARRLDSDRRHASSDADGPVRGPRDRQGGAPDDRARQAGARPGVTDAEFGTHDPPDHGGLGRRHGPGHQADVLDRAGVERGRVAADPLSGRRPATPSSTTARPTRSSARCDIYPARPRAGLLAHDRSRHPVLRRRQGLHPLPRRRQQARRS